MLVARREARRRGLDDDAVYACALCALVGGLVGARLFHLVDRMDFYLQNPAAVLSARQGGLAIWGGIIAGGAACLLYCRLARLPVGAIADLAAPAVLVGQIVGRLGSLLVGDAHGVASDVPWAVAYTHPGAAIADLDVPVHPFPAYEMLWNAAALAIIWRPRRVSDRPGLLFLLYLCLYGLGRLLLDSIRQERIVVFGMQQGQVIGLLVVIAAALWIGAMRPWRPQGAPAS